MSGTEFAGEGEEEGWSGPGDRPYIPGPDGQGFSVRVRLPQHVPGPRLTTRPLRLPSVRDSSLQVARLLSSSTLLIAASLALVGGTGAQELPLKREVVGHPLAECPSWDPDGVEEPTAEEREEARSLASTATERALLGDPQGVRDQLVRATELDPLSEDLAYRRARAHEELGESESAIRWYCRYLSLAPDGEEAGEVRDRLDQLQEPLGPPVSEEALSRFRQGVELLEERALEGAIEELSAAIVADSALAGAYYNRGVALGALSRSSPAIRDLRAYLERRPEAPDRGRVEEAIQFLEDPPSQRSPAGALTLGVLIPGTGHFYARRPVGGAVYLGLAGGAVAVGTLYETVEVSCLTVPRDGECPDDQVRSRISEHPALIPGLAAAGVTAVVSGITAYLAARSHNEAIGRLQISSPESEPDTEAGVSLAPPALVPARDGRLGLAILRLRF